MKNSLLCGFGLMLMSITTLVLIPNQETTASAPSANEGSAAKAWSVDTVHSCALFRVRHMGAGFFWGRFNDVTGTVEFSPDDPGSLKLDVEIDVDSVDSGHPGLDKHLKAPDFFDSKEFPKMTFKSSSVKMVPTTRRADDPVMAWDVTGTITVRGVSKEIDARVTYWGAADMGRGMKAGFETTFKMKRSEFGVNYGVEGGSLGDLVTVTAAFEVNEVK